MASEKAPAFQFYPKDFLSDKHVRVMSMEARGVYITLLAMAWLDGDLPADEESLAIMLGMPVKVFRKVWPIISICFDESHGRLTQKRLEAERAKQAEFRKTASERGEKGAAARWSKHPSGMRIAMLALCSTMALHLHSALCSLRSSI